MTSTHRGRDVGLLSITLLLTLVLGVGLLSGCAALKPQPKPLPAVVVNISEEYANVNTDLSAERLASIGITHGTRFTATYHGHGVEALLGSSYSDVPKGDWIAQVEEDGTMQLAISFGHAAIELGCAVGDTLFVYAPK